MTIFQLTHGEHRRLAFAKNAPRLFIPFPSALPWPMEQPNYPPSNSI